MYDSAREVVSFESREPRRSTMGTKKRKPTPVSEAPTVEVAEPPERWRASRKVLWVSLVVGFERRVRRHV
jgi:hypothetical protein